MAKRILALALLAFAGIASAATDIIAGATAAPTSSVCPAVVISSCSSGWFSLNAAQTATVQVWETTGSKTSTVVLYHRLDSTAATSVLKTWTDVTTSQVPVTLIPPTGEIKVTVTAIQTGATVKAKLSAISATGGKLW